MSFPVCMRHICLSTDKVTCMIVHVLRNKQTNRAKRIKTCRYCIHYKWDCFDHMWPLDVPVEREVVISKSFDGITRAKSPQSLPPLTKAELRRT